MTGKAHGEPRRGGRAYLIQQRGLWKDSLFADEPFTEREAWLWMWEHACYQKSEFRQKQMFHVILPGQIPTSYLALSDRFHWSRGKVRRFLSALEHAGKITMRDDSRFLLLSLCEYRAVQNISASQEPQPSSGQHAANIGTTSQPELLGGNSELPEERSHQPPRAQLQAKRPKAGQSDSETTLRFEEFWLAYPLKKGKKKALAAFSRAVTRTSFVAIMEALESYRKEVSGIEARWIKHPSTWLNSDSWADDHVSASTPLGAAIGGYVPMHPGAGG